MALTPNLASRLEKMDEQNRLDDIQSEAGRHGLVLLQAAALGVGVGDAPSIAELITIGRQLRSVEIRRIKMDGGKSVRSVLDDVRTASAQLNKWLGNLSGS